MQKASKDLRLISRELKILVPHGGDPSTVYNGLYNICNSGDASFVYSLCGTSLFHMATLHGTGESVLNSEIHVYFVVKEL